MSLESAALGVYKSKGSKERVILSDQIYNLIYNLDDLAEDLHRALAALDEIMLNPKSKRQVTRAVAKVKRAFKTNIKDTLDIFNSAFAEEVK